MVNVDELQKVVAKITRDKVNTKEPPYSIPKATSGYPQNKKLEDTSVEVDTIVKVGMIEQHTEIAGETTKEQGKIDASIPTAQIEGPP